MKYKNTTPVPNVLLDCYLNQLRSAELKVLLVIIRQTLGWVDKNAPYGRKERDWISGGQLQSKTGCSRRSITSALEVLIKKQLIEVSDYFGSSLLLSSQRKGKQRLYYRSTSLLFLPVDKAGKRSELVFKSNYQETKIAQGLRNDVALLAHNLRTTK